MSFREAFEIVAANPLLQLCEPGISTRKLASQVNKALGEDSAYAGTLEDCSQISFAIC